MTYSGEPLFPGRRNRIPPWVMAVIVLSVVVVILVPVGFVVSFFYVWGKNHENLRFPSDDVTLSSCRQDAVTGRPVVEVLVVSEAAQRGTFTVHVEFRDARGKGKGKGEGNSSPAGKRTVVFKDLERGGTETEEVVGPAPVRGRPECVVADATFLSTALAATSRPGAP
ncbi:hypothetical protein OG609_14980 [Streptomyces sp. NBC_01224]|uniref:hypothetical protein n=1 Tax=Streptomyces sp. NBC_01224 TaxID=2903783 RepID=UPI002E14FE11|nr:hypothetical protein OG609_14980 [Streptomyces sp. NBC_01224]